MFENPTGHGHVIPRTSGLDHLGLRPIADGHKGSTRPEWTEQAQGAHNLKKRFLAPTAIALAVAARGEWWADARDSVCVGRHPHGLADDR